MRKSINRDGCALKLRPDRKQQIAGGIRVAATCGVYRCSRRGFDRDHLTRPHGIDLPVYFDVPEDISLVGYVNGNARVLGLRIARMVMDSEEPRQHKG